MRILIAEDDPTTRIMLRSVLSKWGYGVVAVRDGEEAWEILQDPEPPPIVILDWVMPGIDGPTLCRRLREEHRLASSYVILLTSKGGMQDIVRGLEAGADDYISKPYDSEELRARVQVGARILKLQAESREREKLLGVLEMAGAVCHELNQPLQSVLGFSELLDLDLPEGDPLKKPLRRIRDGIERIGTLTGRIMSITRYRSKTYLGSSKIVDIEGASVGEPPVTPLVGQRESVERREGEDDDRKTDPRGG